MSSPPHMKRSAGLSPSRRVPFAAFAMGAPPSTAYQHSAQALSPGTPALAAAADAAAVPASPGVEVASVGSAPFIPRATVLTHSASGGQLTQARSNSTPGESQAQSLDLRSFGSLRSSPTSSTSSLLDTGHAFEWPVPRATSTNALTDMNSGMTDMGAEIISLSDLTLEHCLAAEHAFVNVLLDIGERLRRFPTKDMRRTQLFGELSLLNLNLPARVYLPLSIGGVDDMGAQSGRLAADPPPPRHASVCSHHVVRIPPQEALTLNSKDRAPFMLQVEVVDCDDFYTSPLPPKLTVAHARRGGHKRSLSEGGSKYASRVMVVADGPVFVSSERHDRTRTVSGPAGGTDEAGVVAQQDGAVTVSAPVGGTDATAPPLDPADTVDTDAVAGEASEATGGDAAGTDVHAGVGTDDALAAAIAGDIRSNLAAQTKDGAGSDAEGKRETGDSTTSKSEAPHKVSSATPARSGSFSSRWFGWFRSRSTSTPASDSSSVRPKRPLSPVRGPSFDESDAARTGEDTTAGATVGAPEGAESTGSPAEDGTHSTAVRQGAPVPLRPLSCELGNEGADEQRTPVPSPARTSLVLSSSVSSSSHVASDMTDTADAAGRAGAGQEPAQEEAHGEMEAELELEVEGKVSSGSVDSAVATAGSSARTHPVSPLTTGTSVSSETVVGRRSVGDDGDEHEHEGGDALSVSQLSDELDDDSASVSSMSVKDIRLRLSEASNTPESRFQRGHADPSAVRAKEPWAEKVNWNSGEWRVG